MDAVSKVEVLPGQMPTSPDSYTPTGSKLSTMQTVTNKGSNAQTVSVAFSFTQDLSTTITFDKTLSSSFEASLTLGVPELAEGGLGFTRSQEFREGQAKSVTRSVSVNYNLDQEVRTRGARWPRGVQPPLSAVSSWRRAVGPISNITARPTRLPADPTPHNTGAARARASVGGGRVWDWVWVWVRSARFVRRTARGHCAMLQRFAARR